MPILIQTGLTTFCTESVSSRCDAFAALDINTSAVGFKTLMAVCTDETCGTNTSSFSGALSTFARSGAAGDFLNLRVQAAAAGGFSLIDESASASADPFILVDPSFANASLYSIVVSPGVGNALPSPVPEPATTARMCTTIGVLGLLRRRAIRR